MSSRAVELGKFRVNTMEVGVRWWRLAEKGVATNVGRASGDHEQRPVGRSVTPVAPSWQQYIFGLAMLRMVVIPLGTKCGVMMCPNRVAGE